MLTYIKTIFTKPKEIYTGRNMKRSHYFSLILLLSFVLTLLSSIEMIPVAKQFKSDYETITSSIPEFELTDNQLESEEESYIYQTDSLVFYFDAEDRMKTNTIDQNMKTQADPVSLALLKDEIYFNALGSGYGFSYASFNKLNAEDLGELLQSASNFTPSMYLISLVILFILNLFIYLYQLFPITLFGNLIAVYRRTGLRFFQNAKIALLASIGPFLLMYGVNVFQLNVPYEFEIIFAASIILFYMSITEFKKRREQQINSKNEE